MNINPLTYPSDDGKIAASPDRSSHPKFEGKPAFEIMNLEDYRIFRNTSADLIIGASIFSAEPDTLFEWRPFETLSSLRPIGRDSWVELYRFPESERVPAITRDQDIELRISHTDNVAFGHWEADLVETETVEQLTQRAYRSILIALRKLHGFKLWRCWNVIPNVHKKSGNVDHYMQFCLGRHKALVIEEKLALNALPAASAVGSAGNRFQINFIAGKRQGKAFENPEQISAYEYPRQYGPASPSFSRCVFAGEQLWLSGTASIAGHQSLHAADLPAQIHETASRIKSLVTSVANTTDFAVHLPKNLKVYLRHHYSADVLLSTLESAFPEGTTYHLVEADICRDDLLVEIEGVAP